MRESVPVHTAVDLLMDGLGDEIKAEEYFLGELNHIIESRNKEK
jgi:hypothetical protein